MQGSLLRQIINRVLFLSTCAKIDNDLLNHLHLVLNNNYPEIERKSASIASCKNFVSLADIVALSIRELICNSYCVRDLRVSYSRIKYRRNNL
jgi:hypothetical protein